MLRPDPGGVLFQAQAPESAPPGLGVVSRLVQSEHLDRRPAPGPAAAGAVVPGVRQAGRPHPGHGGGPHRTTSGGLGQVRGPGQPPEPVQDLSRPQNGSGNGRRTAEKSKNHLTRNRRKLPEGLGAGAGRARRQGFSQKHRPAKFCAGCKPRPQAALGRRFFPHGDSGGREKQEKEPEKRDWMEVRGWQDRDSRWKLCRPRAGST